MASPINKEWHLAHRMPEKASMDQRIHWHVEHRKHCRCRPEIPLRVREEMEERGMR
ncbi:MAG: hypothetical protein PHW10_03380 [Candidatus Peribacteraceae bacterium]|nr:hypothetical protein [Candidatus Peribacteraceae bacterium]